MKREIFPALLAGVCLGIMAPAAHADISNQKTIFTFNAPVEVPGRVLNPGTYVFKVENNLADRDVVQIFKDNNGKQHLVGTFITVPDYRLNTPGKPIINFGERAAGSPEAVRAWFYPGDNFGHEFVYPKSKALELAKANHQPVASMSDQDFSSSSMKQGHIKAVQPTGEEIEVIEVFGSAPPTTTSQTKPRSSKH